jgi:hypothetical protein
MFQDDKCGIIYGDLCPMALDQHGRFDGKKFTLDEDGLRVELQVAADAGANAVRFLPDFTGVWGKHPGGKKSQFQPYILNAKETAWVLGTYSKDKGWTPAYNTYFFPIQDRIFQIANEAGLTVIYCLFEGCQFNSGARIWSPWYSNEQGVTSFYEPKADVFSRPWVSTMMLRAARRDVILSFGNEINNQGSPDFVKRVIFPYLKLRKWDFNKLFYGATMMHMTYLGNHKYEEKMYPLEWIKGDLGDTFGDEAKLNTFREIHGCGGPIEKDDRPFGADVDQALSWWGKNPIRKVFSDDGCYLNDKNASKCDVRIGKGARPSAETWGAMAKMIFAKYPAAAGSRSKLINFEHLPAGFSTGSLECKVAPIKAISGAYRAKFGAWPKNYKP